MHVYFKIASLSEPDTFIPILMHIFYRNILFSLNCLLSTLTDSEQKIRSTEQSFEINKHLEEKTNLGLCMTPIAKKSLVIM